MKSISCYISEGMQKFLVNRKAAHRDVRGDVRGEMRMEVTRYLGRGEICETYDCTDYDVNSSELHAEIPGSYEKVKRFELSWGTIKDVKLLDENDKVLFMCWDVTGFSAARDGKETSVEVTFREGSCTVLESAGSFLVKRKRLEDIDAHEGDWKCVLNVPGSKQAGHLMMHFRCSSYSIFNDGTVMIETSGQSVSKSRLNFYAKKGADMIIKDAVDGGVIVRCSGLNAVETESGSGTITMKFRSAEEK